LALNPAGFSDVKSEKKPMIYVTRLNHSSVVLNCDLIEHIEATPDTVVTLTSGQKITVLETAEDIIERVRVWRQSLLFSSAPPAIENGPAAARPAGAVWHAARGMRKDKAHGPV
jgi:flagellar protein FlbD